ncbi:DUF4232 domain-containing protein [Streptomyces sp. SAS_270]|uniref:DUF4232 domain-containing protein n=1 Tax=Streptomyces sp. SAS_270 TaxID=3412748 RepID=UPI00403C35BC
MRVVPIAVTALAVAFALTACDDSGGDGGGDKTATSTAGAGSTAGSKSGTGCRLDGVGVQVGPASEAPAAGDTGIVPVTLTNRGATCTLQDFPGIELTTGDASYDVAGDKRAKPLKLTLKKGETATFTVTYVRGASGGKNSAAVTDMNISLPGSDAQAGYSWKYGDVSLKSGGKPDASVSSFQQAGD